MDADRLYNSVIDLSIVSFVSADWEDGTRADTLKTMAQEAVWFWIWSSYFQKSKRVFAYYGKNAG